MEDPTWTSSCPFLTLIQESSYLSMVLPLVLFWKALVLLNTIETPASTISLSLDINGAPWS